VVGIASTKISDRHSDFPVGTGALCLNFPSPVQSSFTCPTIPEACSELQFINPSTRLFKKHHRIEHLSLQCRDLRISEITRRPGQQPERPHLTSNMCGDMPFPANFAMQRKETRLWQTFIFLFCFFLHFSYSRVLVFST
jgi:hypothetical protein